jgi:hypothetical protein
MKNILSALMCVAAVGLSSVAANASTVTHLTLSHGSYLGYVTSGTPASGDDEESYINDLISGVVSPCGDRGNNTCVRSGNDFESLPLADFQSKIEKKNDLDDAIDVTGFAYLLAKYGKGGNDGMQTSHVWYVSGLGWVTVAQTVDGSGGLSHISLFGPGSTPPPPPPPPSVPDGGATLMLLGSAMVGLGVLRRKFDI